MTDQNQSPRFLRDKEQRWMLFNWSDGKCSICGCPITFDNFHADHIDPHIKTKRTNVYEMQALCPSCNARKGARA